MQEHRFDTCSGKISLAEEHLGLCATTTEKPTHLEPMLHKRPQQWEAHTLQRRVAPAQSNYRKPVCSNEDPAQ